MSRSNEPPVLIVGAGPTGLVLALWLTRLGIGVRIIDKLAEAGTTSRALAVQARTLELYRMIGIADRVVEGGVKMAAINLWVRGRRATRVPLLDLGSRYSRFGFPLVFPQDAHERLLIAELKDLGVQVERRTELLRCSEDPGRIRAVLRRPDGAEEICEAVYLAGCDGARSAVRENLGIGFPGGTYEGLFYVADVQADGPATDHELHVDLDKSDLLIVFPLQAKGCVRLVGNVRDTQAKADRELSFDDVSPRAVQNLRLKIEKVNWFSTYRVHHRVAHTFRRGRVFLLGDAAHIHSPVGGQGMNTGIGDAVNLAWKLAEVLRRAADPWILDTYETERIAFARRLVATTDRGFTLATARGALARTIRTRFIPWLAPLAFRLPGLRPFFFRTVSQLGVNYPGSALSRGRAGRLGAGDRLPWVQTASGDDNFAPLTSLRWQVHIYGDPHPGVSETCETLQLPLHIFPWSPLLRRSRLKRGALYLIRPDGYLAFIEPDGHPAELKTYFADLLVPKH